MTRTPWSRYRRWSVACVSLWCASRLASVAGTLSAEFASSTRCAGIRRSAPPVERFVTTGAALSFGLFYLFCTYLVCSTTIPPPRPPCFSSLYADCFLCLLLSLSSAIFGLEGLFRTSPEPLQQDACHLLEKPMAEHRIVLCKVASWTEAPSAFDLRLVVKRPCCVVGELDVVILPQKVLSLSLWII